MIHKDKRYKTRDGRPVRIYATDGWGTFPVHGAMATRGEGDRWLSRCWRENGSATVKGESVNDLIEVMPAIQPVEQKRLDIPAEVRKFRDRVEELEEELLQIKRDLGPVHNPFMGRLGLSTQMACLLHLMYRSHICSQEQLDRVTEVTGNARRGEDEGLVMNRTKVAICKLRARLKKYDVEVQTLCGFGYQLLPVDKDKLDRLLQTKC